MSENVQSKPPGKRIIIFADGTGNAFSAQESNVWRLYQALDLNQPNLVTHYIPGVGTSKFKPFAFLDAATGVGVPANVRKLYRFLCWNWDKEEDEVFIFGFSRGAFTARTLAALVKNQGLMPAFEANGDLVSTAAMARNAMGAWRAYRKNTAPGGLLHLGPIVVGSRVIRDILVRFWRWASGARQHAEVVAERDNLAENNKEQAFRRRPSITFLGLFDTVEAYGVPVEELRKAIDWTLWPVSFRNNRLAENVQFARHALSIDDERTSFHPLRIEHAPGNSDETKRVREVWFAGSHSDVGGGYPDGRVSYIPLLWMAQEFINFASKDIFIPGAIEAYAAKDCAIAALHDSRSGAGVLYRYDPRTIAAGAANGGLPIIHHSVFEHMVMGPDNYAPLNLCPEDQDDDAELFQVWLPDGRVRNLCDVKKELQATSSSGHPRSEAETVSDACLKQICVPHAKFSARAHNLVWWRRHAYFWLLLAIVATVTIPLWGDSVFDSSQVASVGYLNALLRVCLESLISFIGAFFPSYGLFWLNYAKASPVLVTSALVALGAMFWLNGWLRDRIQDYMRLAWYRKKSAQSGHWDGAQAREARRTGSFDDLSRSAPASLWHRFTEAFRKGPISRGIHRLWSGLITALGIIAIFGAMAVVISRTTVNSSLGSGAICKDAETASSGPNGIAFSPNSRCTNTKFELLKGAKYHIEIVHQDPFFDLTTYASPAGFATRSWAHLAGLPFRRWWRAQWFAPIAQIGDNAAAHFPLEPFEEPPVIPGDAAHTLDILGAALDFREPYTVLKERLPPDDWRRILQNRTSLQNLGCREEKMKHAAPAPSEATGRDSDCVNVSDTEGPADSGYKRFVSDFTAPTDGVLYLYVNDAMIGFPFLGVDVLDFYANNSGSATVKLFRKQNDGRLEPVPQLTSAR
jgi:uncharacterized protein (DUF2235 family)